MLKDLQHVSRRKYWLAIRRRNNVKFSALYAVLSCTLVLMLMLVPVAAEAADNAVGVTAHGKPARGTLVRGKHAHAHGRGKARAGACKAAHKGRHHKAKGCAASRPWLVSDTQGSAPQPQAVEQVLAQDEKIYDGPLPDEESAVLMDAVPDPKGRTECVQLLKSLLSAPRTTFWKEGRRLKQYFADIKPGTAIATFVHGRYPQGGGHGKHAAIFVRATQTGIYVIDQFAGQVEVAERFIPWHHPSDRRAANNAVSYSTVRW